MARKKSTLDTRPEEKKVFISEADQFLFAQGTHYDLSLIHI